LAEYTEKLLAGETIAERAEMKKLINDVENKKWRGVLVMEVERLARGDTSDQGIIEAAFKYSGTKIITPVKTYEPNNEMDEEIFAFGLFMSRREYKVINRRLQRGRETSVKEGKYVGNIPPYGYKRKKLENAKGYTLEIEEDEATIVKQIFSMYAYECFSMNKIVIELNRSGIKPRIATEWTISTIKDILANPVYVGKIRWNARKQVISTQNGQRKKSRPRNDEFLLVDGLHPSIIDDETWNVVVNKRKMNVAPVQHHNVVQNPLSGLIFCEKCGKPMQRRPYKKADKPATLMCANSKCDNISSKLYIVEDKIIQALKIWLKNYKINYEEIVSNNKSTIVFNNKEQLKLLDSKLSKEKHKANKIYEFYEDGTYDKQEFTERISIVKSCIADLEEKITSIQSKIDEEEKMEKQKKLIIPIFENVLDIYYKLETSEEKNNLLKTILEKVTYKKTEKSIKKDADPSNFEIHIYPKIPKM